MLSNFDYTSPAAQFSFDLNKSTFFRKDSNNYINVLGIQQLNTLDQVSLLDIYLSANNVIEPHYHQNAAELVYCITGAAIVSILNPFTKQLHNYPITPGQVANVPQGWWHYEVATTDNTHLLAIFNASTPEVILGSDILKLTPSNIISHTYCIDENQWNQAIAPVKPNTFIGPYTDCNKSTQQITYQNETPQYFSQQYNPYQQQISYMPYYWQ